MTGSGDTARDSGRQDRTRRHTGRCLIVVLLLALAKLLPAAGALAGPDDAFPTTPRTNDGQRWRIAYYQGGDYIDCAAGLPVR